MPDHRRMKSFIILGFVAVVAAGCEGDADGGSCGKVAACGGNIVADWSIEDICLEGAFETAFSCPTAKLDISGLSLTGTVSYKADGTYSAATTTGGTMKMTLPEACFSQGGVVADCAKIAADANEDKKFETVTCAAAGKGCSCTFALKTESGLETGTYVTAGNALTETSDGDSNVSGYCVKGNELHITDPSALGMMPNMMGAMTASAGVVLKRK